MRRHGAVKIDMYLIADLRQRAQMMRKNDADHRKKKNPNPKFQIPGNPKC